MSVRTASSQAQARVPSPGTAGHYLSRLVESDIASAAARLRGAEHRSRRGSNGRRTGARVRALARSAITRAGANDRGNRASAGYSVAMLENSIDALLKPFTIDALKSIGCADFDERQGRQAKDGWIYRGGQCCGAGIHEIAIALSQAQRVMVKTASAEPIFFAEFARTLAEVDRDAAARIEVLQLEPRARRSDRGVDCELRSGGRVRRRRDDRVASHRSNVIGFGSRVSAAVVAPVLPIRGVSTAVVERLARDVVLFEQLGCLSLHQVFVVSRDRRRSARSGDPNVGGARTHGEIDAAGENSIARRCRNTRSAGARALAADCGRAGRAV